MPRNAFLLKEIPVLGREAFLRCFQVFERLAEEAAGPTSAVVDSVADFWFHHPNDGANQGARRVVFAAIAPGVAHVADFGFVEVGKLVLLGLRAKLELVNLVEDFAKIVAVVDLVLDLAENLADLVLDRIGVSLPRFETLQVGEKLAVDEIDEVFARLRAVAIEVAVFVLRSGPGFPPVWLFEDVGVLAALDSSGGFAFFFESIQILEEKNPGGLLGVVEFGRAAGLFTQYIVYISEDLLEHPASAHTVRWPNL